MKLKDQNLNLLWIDCVMCSHFDSRSFQWWISKSLVDFFLVFFQVASVLPGTLNWMATSLLGLFFSGSFSALSFVLKSLRYAFFLWPFWIQYTSDFLSRINLQNNQIQRLKNIRIGKFERDIFSILLSVTSSKTRREKWIFKIKIRITW